MFLVIWEFQVKAGREAEFEHIYGPDGDWAALFKREPGYLGTDLLIDARDSCGYMTIDRWVSPAAYEAFKREWFAEYDALDAACDGLTDGETLIGRFRSDP
jgi:heme-degrading monooxygenase HmoA